MKKIIYAPKGGVCSRQIDIELQGNKISKVKFTGGCSGNTSGLSRLLEGMDANEAVRRLQGIDCKGRGTSCPDQLAQAILENLQ